MLTMARLNDLLCNLRALVSFQGVQKSTNVEVSFLSELQTDGVPDKLQGIILIFLYVTVLQTNSRIEGFNSHSSFMLIVLPVLHCKSSSNR